VRRVELKKVFPEQKGGKVKLTSQTMHIEYPPEDILAWSREQAEREEGESGELVEVPSHGRRCRFY